MGLALVFWSASTSLAQSGASGPLVDVLHYVIETVADGPNLRGTTTVRARVTAPSQTVAFALHPNLKLESVTLAGSEPATRLEPARSTTSDCCDYQLTLPQPVDPDEELELRFEYAGDDVLADDGGGTYVSDAHGFYPTFGSGDRSTYELSYRLPRGSELVSVGHRDRAGREDGREVSHWRESTPVSMARFVYGELQAIEHPDSASGVLLRSFVNPRLKASVDGVVLEAEGVALRQLQDAVDALGYFSVPFGPLPHQKLVLVQLARLEDEASAGASSMIVQGLPAGDRSSLYRAIARTWLERMEPASEEEAWLVPGLVFFAQGLTLQKLEPAAYHEFWEKAASRAASGPVVLDEAPANRTDAAVAKGAFVWHMLRAMMQDSKSPEPDARFFAMLRDFVTSYGGQRVSVEQLEVVMKRHMIPELDASRTGTADWFFQQWVKRDQIPQYVTDVRIEDLGGEQYRLVGTVTQEGVSEDFMAIVPMYLFFGDDRYGAFGRAVFKGNMTHQIQGTLKLPERPESVVPNARHEVLSRQ